MSTLFGVEWTTRQPWPKLVYEFQSVTDCQDRVFCASRSEQELVRFRRSSDEGDLSFKSPLRGNRPIQRRLPGLYGSNMDGSLRMETHK
jgi:hypothetical protein